MERPREEREQVIMNIEFIASMASILHMRIHDDSSCRNAWEFSRPTDDVCKLIKYWVILFTWNFYMKTPFARKRESCVSLSLSCDLNNLPLIKSVEKCSLKSRWRQLAGKRLKSGPRPFNPSKTVLTGHCTIYHFILAWSLQLIVIQRPCIVRSYSENHIFMLILLLSTALFNFLTIFDHAENTRWILSGNIKCWKTSTIDWLY